MLKIKKLDFMPFFNRMICFVDVKNPDEADKKALAKDILENNKDQYQGYDQAIFYFQVSKKDKTIKPENSIVFIMNRESGESLLVNEKYRGGSNGISRKSKAINAQAISNE